MRILVLDNYDSFTYNLVHILRKENCEVEVRRNDKISPDECQSCDALILSPGPGIPRNAGNLMPIIKRCSGSIPILGICLGHQAIAEYLGARLVNLQEIYHGIQSEIQLINQDNELLTGVGDRFQAGRYHSWAVDPQSLNHQIEVSAKSEDGCIMALQNKEHKLYGLQFHPESIMTPKGHVFIENFISIAKRESL